MTRSASLVGALLLVTAAVCQAQQPAPLATTQPPPPPSPLAYVPPAPPPPPPGPVTDAVPGAFVPVADVSGGVVAVGLAYLKPTLQFGLLSPVPPRPFRPTLRPP